MNADPGRSGDLAGFREAVRARNWTGLVISGLIVAALEPVYWMLDQRIVPAERLDVAFVARCALFTLGIVLALIGARRPRAVRAFDLEMSLGLAIVVTSTMNVFVAWTGGAESDYFVGILFTMIVVGFVFSWPIRVVVGFHVAAVIPYVATAAVDASPITLEGVSHVVYLATAAGVTAVSQFVRQRLEEREFQAKHALSLTTDRLQAANERLKELDRAKNEFFGTITHELRTPLTMILSPVDAMLQRRDELNERQASSLTLARRHALKLLKLVNDILDLAKMDDGKLRLQLREVDVRELAEEIVTSCAPHASRKEIDVSLNVSGGDHTVWADPDKLERALLNLVANALKFTDIGGRVEVRILARGGHVDLEVQDNGIGIHADKLEVVFERFAQADPSANRRYGGTGLGLSFARSIAQLHGGSLTVASELGVGSTFTLSLRAGRGHLDDRVIERRRRDAGAAVERRAEDVALREWSQAVQDEAEYKYLDIVEVTDRRAVERGVDEGKHTKVLVVEDSIDMLQFIHAQLVDKHQVYTAQSGRQGVELAARVRPDAIITDYMMPDMNGVELCTAIRGMPDIADTPILMLTARFAPEDRRAGRRAGADVYLTKPFDPAELDAVIRRFLEQRGRALSSLAAAHAKSLELMSAGLAHEIHNPLSWIKNAHFVLAESARRLAQAARPDDTAADGNAKALQRIEAMVPVAERGIGRIESIVGLIQRYAREGYPTVPADVRFDEVVRRILEVAVVVPDGVRIEVDLRCADVAVAGVEVELAQVARTLVQNALDACGEGRGTRVQVETTRDGDTMVFTVRDDGPGIAPANLHRIFTPFFSTKAASEGMGLGLAIAHQVVTAARGTIHVESEPSRGATFTVSVPVSMTTSGRLSPER